MREIALKQVELHEYNYVFGAEPKKRKTEKIKTLIYGENHFAEQLAYVVIIFLSLLLFVHLHDFREQLQQKRRRICFEKLPFEKDPFC